MQVETAIEDLSFHRTDLTFRSGTRKLPVGMSEPIVNSAVKDVLSEQNVAAGFYDILDEEVSELLEDAAQRADANDRKTVQPRDL